MPEREFISVGIDPAVSATGVAAVRLVRFNNSWRPCERAWVVAVTDPGVPLPDRLAWLSDAVGRAVGAVVTGAHPRVDADRVRLGIPLDVDVVGIEDFARSSRFAREEMGMAYAVVAIAVARLRLRCSPRVAAVPIQAAKRIARPTWYGYTKAEWEAAGMRGKFKRSNPGKGDVATGVHQRFGFVASNEHAVDAYCIALAAAGVPIEDHRTKGVGYGEEVRQ